jgi:Subtilisin inhibitor-like
VSRTTLVLALALALLPVAAAQAATPKASLKVTYWAKGSTGSSVTWTLRCDPAAGTHPAPRLACRALAAHAADLGRATRACTLMPTLTSPRATIKGTWAGRRVERTYRIGCAGWRDLRIVLTGK